MEVAGLIVGVIATLLALLAIPTWWRDLQRRKWHVLDVSAHIEGQWAPVPGEENTNVLVGGTLTLENKGAHTVTNVHVEAPEALSNHPSTYRRALASGERRDISLTAQQMMALPVDPLVSLNLTDHKNRSWVWTPEAQYVEGVTGKRVGLRPAAKPRPWWSRLPGGTKRYVDQVERQNELDAARRREVEGGEDRQDQT